MLGHCTEKHLKMLQSFLCRTKKEQSAQMREKNLFGWTWLAPIKKYAIVCFCNDIQLFNGHVEIPNRKINFENIFFLCCLTVIAWNRQCLHGWVSVWMTVSLPCATVCMLLPHRCCKWLCLSMVQPEKSLFIFPC